MLLLLLGTLRGGATSLSKYVSSSGVPPLGYSLWQSLIVAVLLLGIGFARGRKLPPISRYPRYYVFCALSGVAIPNVIFFYVVKSLPAGTMAVLLTLAPIVTYLLVLALRMERIDGMRIAGIGLGFVGALMISMPRITAELTFDGWVLLGILCPLGYASMGVYVARFPVTEIPLTLLAGGTHLVAVLFLLPATLFAGDFFLLWRDAGLVELLIVCHGLIAAVAYSLFFRIVQLAGPVFYSFSTYVIAITGIGWGWLVFAESHPRHFWLAVAMIFSGLALIQYRQRHPATGDDG